MVQSSRKSWQREPKLGRRSARLAPKDVLPKEAEIIKRQVELLVRLGITCSGWWLTYPSEKWWSSSVGIMTFPTEWKKIVRTTNQITIMFPLLLVYSLLTTINHQPPTRIFSTNQWFFSSFWRPQAFPSRFTCQQIRCFQQLLHGSAAKLLEKWCFHQKTHEGLTCKYLD